MVLRRGLGEGKGTPRTNQGVTSSCCQDQHFLYSYERLSGRRFVSEPEMACGKKDEACLSRMEATCKPLQRQDDVEKGHVTLSELADIVPPTAEDQPSKLWWHVLDLG